MKYLAILATGVLFLVGCGGESRQATPSPQPGESAMDDIPYIPPSESTPELTVGDLEAKVDFELNVPAAAPAGVSANEMRSQLQRLNLVTVTVEGAKPAALPLDIDLKTQLEFPNRIVVAQGRLIREIAPDRKDVIATFATVFDENASVRKRMAGGEFPPQHFEADAVQGLDALPETMLLYAEMDIAFVPRGTDPATVDLANFQGSIEDRGVLRSNPLRINYEPGEAPTAPPAEEAADAPAEPSDDATEAAPTETGEAAPGEPAADAPATDAPAPAES
ncbi:MAG: hypothetical protein KF886_04145 [Candidatus Hydrogenedentes bacterium]|nr:hypothetical protein [Candidatus Hydrogenedentota bacterium]